MNRRLFDILIILLLGLLPLLWFPGQTMLFGHDAGIPFDPVTHFLDRFSVWSQRLGIGTDQSFGLLGALPIHGLEALLIWLGFSIKTQQLIQFSIWFVLPGLTMYFFVSKIWSEKKYLPLIASIIYMLNYYLIQGWFVAERTKFSLYVGVPIIVYYSYSYLMGKTSLKKSAIIIGLTWLIFNGGGSFPLYGGLFILMGVSLLYLNFIYFGKQMLIRTFLLLSSTTALYVLVNAYWILPYTYYVLGFYSRDLANTGGAAGALSWTEYLSKGSTFINLFRGQGIPDWYLNNFHPFASYFLNNPFLIVVSFLFPLAAYASLLFIKNKKDKFYIYLFVLVSLVTLIFSAGPRSQLGAIFEGMMLYVPGFAIFRSAFYKFTYAQWFAYAILIGFTLDFLLTRFETKLKKVKQMINPSYVTTALLGIFIVGYTLYHFPALTGVFMDYSNEPGKKLSTRITVPQHVFDFGNWSNKQDPTKRYLLVPELSETGYIVYQWGYWSLAPINSIQTKNSFVQNTFLVPPSERLLLKQMYTALAKGDIKSFTDFTEVFAIDGIVVQEDFDWKNPTWGTVDPATYESVLNNNPDFKLVQSFDKWKVYDIVGRERSLRVTATPRLSYLDGELNNLVSFPFFDPKSPLFMASGDPNSAYFINEATDVFLGPECIDCYVKGPDVGFQYYNPKVLPGSLFYPFVLKKEQLVKKRATDFNSYLNFLLTTSDRRIIEAKWMIDSGRHRDNLDAALTTYIATLDELHTLVSKKDWGFSGKVENTAAQTTYAHLLEQANLIESSYDSVATNITTRGLIDSAYSKVLEINKLVQQRMWITTELVEKKYLFELPKAGDYSLYVKKSSLANPDLASSDLTISIPEAGITDLKPIDDSAGWINFGSVNLEKKTLKLSMRDTTVQNVVDVSNPILPEDASGIRNENNVYTFTTDSKNKCMSFALHDLDTLDSQYIISFAYRNFTEKDDLGFYFGKPNEKVSDIFVKSTFLKNSRSWVKNTDMLGREKYLVFPTTPELNIFFCNGFSTLKESLRNPEPSSLPAQDVIQIKDITVQKISVPSIILHQSKQDIPAEEFVTNVNKPDTVNYFVDVKPTNRSVTVNMRESYGKFWKICEENGKCLSFDDKNHFAAAGFTNAWYFKDGLKGNLHFYYYPQENYIIGAYITIGSLIVILGGICWYKLRRK